MTADKADEVELGVSMSLQDWLAAVEDPKRKRTHLVTYQFPTDSHRAEYLQGIGKRSDDEIRRLLRCFLIGSGTLGSDIMTAQWLASRLKQGSPFRRRNSRGACSAPR